MGQNWNFVWTPQFLVGTLIAGLLLNVLGAYVVRAVDRMRVHLPAYFRRARDEEAARIQLLYKAAASDNALYAALASEAGSLRLYQLLCFFIAFVAIVTLLFAIAISRMEAVAASTTAGRLELGVLVVFLVPFGFLQYISGLENGRRANRLDAALLAVHSDRSFPVMD